MMGYGFGNMMGGYGYNMMGGGGFGYGFPGVWGIGMGIMMLVRFFIFAVIIWWAVKFFRNYTSRNSAPMKILNEKYANGEISEEEYMKRKNILS